MPKENPWSYLQITPLSSESVLYFGEHSAAHLWGCSRSMPAGNSVQLPQSPVLTQMKRGHIPELVSGVQIVALDVGIPIVSLVPLSSCSFRAH